MIKLIREFLDFLAVRRLVEFTNPMEDDDTMKYIMGRVKEDVEIAINSVVIYELTKMMVKEDISPEFLRGFKSALDYRIQVIRNHRKFIPTKK